ncbi:MAG: glycosyltransferase family 9 protein [Chlamydiales bacterium]|nr:glycosyltransferase family 9 protein [Chlamydiales bacterium]
MSREINSILIVKIGAIGDVVMSLPMLSLLRQKHPNAHITWLCGKSAAPLVEAAALTDEMLLIDETQLFQRGAGRRILALIAIWRVLFFRRFDLVITAHPDPRYQLISLFCRKKLHRFFNRRQKRSFPLFGRYHLYEYNRLADPTEGPLSPSPSFPKLHLETTPFLEGFLASLPSRPIVVVAPGGAKNALSDNPLRRWPASHYADLLKQLSSLPVNLIVTGAESDHWIEPLLSEITYHNLIGKLSLLELVMLLKKTKLFITHDSGPLHLSKLAECPTIALFGPTNPSEKVSPSENIHVFWERMPCAPCYDGKKYAQCTQNSCMRNISPAAVAKKASELLFPHKL